MRCKLTLRALDAPTVIPINYNYPIAAAIYKIINAASPEYSEWLHSQGYVTPEGKPMKLFTFSRLLNKNMKAEGNVLKMEKHDRCALYISSPMLEDFIKNFVIGLFSIKKIEIAAHGICGRFVVDDVERIDLPELSETLRCVALSPFVASTMKEHNGKLSPYYYRPLDEGLSEALRRNAVQKFQLVHRALPKNDLLTVETDKEYIARRGGERRTTKLISIKEADDDETKIVAIHTPVLLKGSIELIDVILQTGIGEKNSLGFGMLAPQ
ncbi:MAG: CRISPR-associated endoribonuclease Cas6 [Bacteroidetes bacterium]|nr:CRISPR-associated endoribonuclease Cas6 [Bacteroidota bacterium]